jgi:hypothetical protein
MVAFVVSHANVQQVAIVIPTILHASCVGQAIGGFIGVVHAALGRDHRQPVPHRVVGVGVRLPAGVCGRGEAVERIVGVGRCVATIGNPSEDDPCCFPCL